MTTKPRRQMTLWGLIHAYAAAHGEFTTSEVVAAIQCQRGANAGLYPSVVSLLSDCVSRGMLERISRGRYRLTGERRD